MSRFERGQFVIYEGRSSYINFVSDQYVTVCIAESLKPPEEAEHSINPYRQVNVVVNPDYWKTIIPDPTKPYNRFSTEYAEIVENIK
tara:strand:- start:569 stop:829 length:261 start_codon:yes stop_codon:yes gene_type:complete